MDTTDMRITRALSIEPQRSLWGICSFVVFVFRNPVWDTSCHNACIFITNATNMRVSRALSVESQRSLWVICPFVAFVYGIHRTDLTNTES